MKAKAHKLGLATRHAEERSHAFVKKVVPAPEQSEPAEVHQSCDVFCARAEMGNLDQQRVNLLSPGPCARIEAALSIAILAAVCDLSVLPKAKKADVVERHKVVHHVGSLFNEPPGKAGLSFS